MVAPSFAEKIRELEVLLLDHGAASATRVLEAARALRKTHPEAVALLRLEAHALLRLERWAEAAETFERVVNIIPTDGAALAGLAHALHQLGRLAEATAAANQAADYLPLRQSTHTALEGERRGNATYQAALLHLRTGQASTAVRQLRSLAALYPERLDIRLMLGLALWRAGARVAAAEHCLALLDDAPDVLAAHVVLCEIWHAAGALTLAAWHAAVVARFDPEHVEARALFGEQFPAALQQMHLPAHTQEAEPALHLPLRPTDQQEGDLLSPRPSWSEAWKPLEEAELPNAASVFPFEALSDVAPPTATATVVDTAAAARVASAEAKRVASLAPSNTHAAALKQARQALRRAQGQKLDELIATLERLRAHTPNDPELLSLLAQAYLRRGDADGALAVYQQALTKI